MADTDTETLPNGTGGLSTEEEDERMKQRPADIDADVRGMERSKRVEALMSSRLFREELERVLDQQMNEGADAPLLQRIKEMVGGRLHTGSLRGPSCVLPINDIRGIEGVGYEKGEKILRCKLAAVYRLVDLFGWTQTGVGSQITARLNTAVEQVLTSPRGLLPHEVTASSLVKVDMQGTVQDQGTTNFPVNVAGFSVHASVHAARPDVRCVLHIRSPAALAVSAMKNGLLPLSTEAAILGEIAYHTVPAGVLDNEERDRVIHILGPHCKVLFLTSNGALCCGETLEEAFYQAKNLTTACDVQLRLASLPLDALHLIDDDARKQMYEASRKPPADGVKWRVGGEEFEALMRMLDNAGFRTGYMYRHPLVKNDVPKPKNDVEVPPAVSSLGYLLEEEEMYKQGLWKKGGGKVGERTRWLNSPNVYQKVEVLETGTTDPKKITKWVDANNEEWVQDGSPAHSSTPVKIDAALQFVPKNTNPKEFKKLQQQIKDNRRADKISAGPQSHILEGVTWDEANKLQTEDATTTHTGDHVVLMGAASKGIIQRGYQHNATMYSAPYARNPFDHVTDREIDEYKRTVERRQRGGEYDTDLSETEALSAAQVTSPLSPSETEEESRDEHRVLRIETKQAPIRSQPEVVLSDVDTTDFLHAERSHADRSRDANLLSDDEVFLSSMASSVTTSAVMSPVTSSVDEPVVVRHQRVAVQQTVIRGVKATDQITSPHKLQANKLTLNPAPCLNRPKQDLPRSKHDYPRSKHDYPRSNNFDNIVKKYNSPEHETYSDTIHPKCKVNLNSRMLSSNESVLPDALEIYQHNASSRSSLYSIPSIEWDGKCKPDYLLKTRSLPRSSRRTNKSNLFRTRSHAGFINSYIKDPEPLHFHLPKCSSCGAVNSSYAWELTRDSVEKKLESKRLEEGAVYEQLDTHKCIEECQDDNAVNPNIVKVKHIMVPIHKVTVDNEFVESQEFNEDCYLGDIANSFSSDNQTVIEKTPTIISEKSEEEKTLKGSPTECATTQAYDKVVKDLNNKFDYAPDVYRAEYVVTEENEDDNSNNSMDSIQGEYLNFSDEMDFEQAVYESPVKDLVEKDIRDYSVPINFYCDDYKTDEESPQKSPRTKREITKPVILEPILEESKSSYGDESSVANSSKNNESESKDQHEKKDDSKIKEEVSITKELVGDVIDTVIKAIELKEEISRNTADKVTSEELEMEYINSRGQESFFMADAESDLAKNDIESVLTAMGLYSEENESFVEAEAIEDKKKIAQSVYENVFAILSEDAICKSDIKAENPLSELDLKKKSLTSEYSTASSCIEMQSFNSTVEFEKYEAVTEIIDSILNLVNFEMDKIRLRFGDSVDIIKKDRNVFFFESTQSVCIEVQEIMKDVTDLHAIGNTIESDEIKEADTTSTENAEENFSMAKMIQDIEEQVVGLNETVLTNNSDLDPKRQSEKVVEGIIYHLLDRTFFLLAEKIGTCKEKKNKKVVTVVDSEDVLFTALPIWECGDMEIENYDKDDSFYTPREAINIEDSVRLRFENTTVEVPLANVFNCNEQNPKDFFMTPFQNDKSATDYTVHLPEVLIMPVLGIEDTFIEPTEYEAIPNIESLPESVKTVIFHVLSDENDESGSIYEDGKNNSPNCKSLSQLGDPESDVLDEKTVIRVKDFENTDAVANAQNQSNNQIKIMEQCEKNIPALASEENVVACVSENIPDRYLEDFSESYTKYQYQCEDVDVCSGNYSYTVANEMLKELMISLGEKNSYGIDAEDNEFVDSNREDKMDKWLNETFVLPSEDKASPVKEEMNTAFVAEHLSFSSPVKDSSKIFDNCEESPIKNPDDTFLGEDLSVLYEKDETILGSPFIKKAPVISMSQSFHSGGIRYWVSFDESLKNVKEKPSIRSAKRFKGNSMPSFFTVDFEEDKKSNKPMDRSWSDDTSKYWEFEKETLKRASVLCEEMTDSRHKSDTDKSFYSANTNDSFATACASKTASYQTCDSSGPPTSLDDKITKVLPDKDTNIPQKKLIYDNSRVDLHSIHKRQYYSWPPFDESVFYRIISKFRMSESFDPSDLENYESSL